jgi:ribose/xylose/arabinose/galactoside ABC-type transport system permease subunit
MTAQQVSPPPATSTSPRPRATLFSRSNTLLVVLVGYALAVGAVQPRFLHWDNITLILATATLLGLVALGEFLVIVSGAVDISIGAIVAVGAVTASVMIHGGSPTLVAVGCALGASILAGCLNGVLVAVAGLPSVVVTLATLSLIRGLLTLLFHGTVLSGNGPSLSWLWERSVLNLPPATLLWLGLAILVAVFVRNTQTGRDIFAVGSNEAASRMAGLRVTRIRILTFALSGLFAGIAGVLLVGQQSALALGQAGTGYEFLAIGAVVLGGTDIFGGSGRVRGVVVGVVLLYAIYNSMVLAGIPAAWQSAVVGGLILAAVIVDTRRSLGRRKAGAA